MSEIEKMPPAADMRYDDEDSDAVAIVMVRVEYRDGRIREYGAAEPLDFSMNDPERDVTVLPMGRAIQAAGSPWVPMNAAVPRLRLSFRANPRHNMVIRTERTAEPSGGDHRHQFAVSAAEETAAHGGDAELNRDVPCRDHDVQLVEEGPGPL